MSADRSAPWLSEFIAYFEQLTPQSLSGLDQWYAQDAVFKDPFNEVRGLAAIRRIFEHMFDSLVAPRFIVTEQLHQGDQVFLVWRFEYRFRGERATRVIQGASHLRLDGQGRVAQHRDYWDAAEELYETLPIVGTLMRWLKRRISTPPAR
jgi:steroid delta-isomerase